MRLNCNLQDIFRATPFDHIWHAQLRAQIRPNTPNTVFGERIRALFTRNAQLVLCFFTNHNHCHPSLINIVGCSSLFVHLPAVGVRSGDEENHGGKERERGVEDP